MNINTTEAPKGYTAAPQQSAITPCHGCAFHDVAPPAYGCAKSANVSCMSYRRADEQTVIFVKA